MLVSEANASEVNKKKPTSFFDLSPELRLLIYEHALIAETKVDLFRHCWHRTAKPERLAYCSLCLTSKQRKNEAQPIFLTKNTFELRMTSFSNRRPFMHTWYRPTYKWELATGVTDKLIRDLRKLTIRAVVHQRDPSHAKPHTRPWLIAPVEIDITFDKAGLVATCDGFRQREFLLLRQRRSVANAGMWLQAPRSTGQRMVQIDEYLGTSTGSKPRGLSMAELMGVVALIDDA